MKNIPKISLGLLAASRDCFPIELSKKRRERVARECKTKNIAVTEMETIVENEKDSLKALEEIRQKNINALVIFLGNFGPEGPATMLAQKFDGPVMFAAASEETGSDLIQGRGDAYCGMLNISYNLGLRHLKSYFSEYPVGIPIEVADMIGDFLPVARIVLGLKKLKIFSFGPRPQDFLACNAPIKPLYDIGVEIMENSELDLYDIHLLAKDDPKIKAIVEDMAKELGKGNHYPELLERLAQYEIALTKFIDDNLGSSEYGIFANKCWPSFEKHFGFVPCFVNSRLASRGYPVACEVDIYGALSEYIATCATELPATLLDINNTFPYDMYEQAKDKVKGYKPSDLFMGFHCGNTTSSCIVNAEMKYQLIMNRLLEAGKNPDITRGTLEGRIRPGEITLFRLQSTAEATFCSYVAEAEVLDIDPKSFGCIGVFAVKEMGRFYRHVLIEKRFPHHSGIAFKHVGKELFAAMKMLGVEDVAYNQPSGRLYKNENPFN